MHWSYDHLDLSEDADARAIKRAYARLLKTVRPDEDPEGFQRLHEAYKAALQVCARRAAMEAAEEEDDDAAPEPGSAGPDRPAIKAAMQDTAAQTPATPARPVDAGRDDAVLEDASRHDANRDEVDQDTHASLPAQQGDTSHPPHADAGPPGIPGMPDSPPDLAPRGDDVWDDEPLHPAHHAHPLPSPFASPTAAADPWAARALAEEVLSMAAASDPPTLNAWLQAQPALWSLADKAAVGDAVLDALQFDRPPLAVAQFDALADFFGLLDLRTGHSPDILLAVRDRLAVIQALDGGDLGAVAERLHQEGSSRAAQQRDIGRMLQQLRRPWSWPQALAMTLVPGLPGRLHRFVQTLRGMGDGDLPAGLDRRQGGFWEAAGDHTRWSWARAAVLALRLALYPLALPLLSWLLQPGTLTPEVASRRYLALFTALGLGWAWLRLSQGFAEWQAGDDMPDGGSLWVLRPVAIPLLLTFGLILHFLPGTEPLSWLLVPPLLLGTLARVVGSNYNTETLVLLLRNGWVWVAVPLALALFGAFSGSGGVRGAVYVILAVLALSMWSGARSQR